MLEWEKRFVGGEVWKPRACLQTPPMEVPVPMNLHPLDQLILKGGIMVPNWSGMNKKLVGSLLRLVSPKAPCPSGISQISWQGDLQCATAQAPPDGMHPFLGWKEGCSSIWYPTCLGWAADMVRDALWFLWALWIKPPFGLSQSHSFPLMALEEQASSALFHFEIKSSILAFKESLLRPISCPTAHAPLSELMPPGVYSSFDIFQLPFQAARDYFWHVKQHFGPTQALVGSGSICCSIVGGEKQKPQTTKEKWHKDMAKNSTSRLPHGVQFTGQGLDVLVAFPPSGQAETMLAQFGFRMFI